MEREIQKGQKALRRRYSKYGKTKEEMGGGKQGKSLSYNRTVF